MAEKRNFILECTGAILKRKSLCFITMKDIIKEAGFSHGAIYRYYSNIDEIYVDFINKNTACNLLENKIDTLLGSEQSEITILSDCIIAMGEYIDELLKSVGGTTFFELLVYYAYDSEKRAAIFPQLKFRQSLEYAQNKIVEYTMGNVAKGTFHLKIPIFSAITFTGIFIDGISLRVAIGTTEGNHQDSALAVDVPEMFQTLAKAVINFLEV
jgi:hypothetical protein